MRDYVKEMNDCNVRVPKKLKDTLNKFFAEVDCAEGCCLRAGDHEGTNGVISLVIESSLLYSYLAGEYGWDIHTKFYEGFTGTGYFPEPANSCVIVFYKD